jgi:hypothetical protein
MSGGALGWAKKTRVGSQSAKLVLFALADWADDAGSCFPSVQTIVDVTELSERAVRAGLRRLEELELLRTERTRKDNGAMGANRYFLMIGSLPKTQDVVGEDDAKQADDAPSASGAGGSTGRRCPTPCTTCPTPLQEVPVYLRMNHQ